MVNSAVLSVLVILSLVPEMDRFKKAVSLTHSEQGIYWLNGSWEAKDNPGPDIAEEVWKIVHTFIEIQNGEPVRYGKRAKNKLEGVSLDEMQAHRVLEKLETLTEQEMQARLLKLDIDNNKRLAVIEYLISKYMPDEQKVVDMVGNMPQGGMDPKKLQEAEHRMQAAQTSMDDSAEAAKIAKNSLQEATVAAKTATSALETEIIFAEELKTARKATEDAYTEAQQSSDVLEQVVKEYHDKISRLEKKTNDKDLSTVNRNSAVIELATLKAEEPLPLRRAKIILSVKLQNVKNARKVAENAAENKIDASRTSEDAKDKLDAKKEESTKAKENSDAAKENAFEAFKNAEKALTELKAEGTGVPQGKVWWMERTLSEM